MNDHNDVSSPNPYDLSSSIGMIEHQRRMDKLQTETGSEEVGYGPFLFGLALLAVFGFIFSYL